MPDEPRRDPVVISGLGALSAVGHGVGALREALSHGVHGLRPALERSTPAFRAGVAATLPDPGWSRSLPERALLGDHDPAALLALAAALEAWRDARLDLHRVRPDRVALALGTSSGGITSRSEYELSPSRDPARRHALLARSGFHVQTGVVAEALGIEGPRLTLSTACTSSANAVGHARDLVAWGLADVALAGGVDVLAEEVFAGFYAMGAMSPGPCAPFSEPVGMTVGEGAGFVVLERASHALRRGVPARATLQGYGLSADAHHATAPDPTGAGLSRAILSALEDSGLGPEAVGYLNAHGTGTEANDPAEWRGILRALGPWAEALPVSSSKGHFGHALGAAGVLELLVTVLSLASQRVPPTLHFTLPRGVAPRDPVAGTLPRAHPFRVAVSVNAAFGGANAALVVTAPPEPSRASVEDRKTIVDPWVMSASGGAPGVVILGAGALAAHGTEGLLRALRGGAPCWSALDPGASGEPLPPFAARVAPFSLEALVRGVDARGFDAPSRLLTAAAALALRASGVRVRGGLRDRAGLFVGASRIPWDSAEEFWGSIRARGFERVSSPAFSRIVLNAAAGAASRALSLRGPLSVVAGGAVGALQSASLAAGMLASRRDADVLVAGAVSALGEGTLADHAYAWRDSPRASAPAPGEGAGCVALATEPWAASAGIVPVARVAGFALGGPSKLAEVIAEALSRGRVRPEEVSLVCGAQDGTLASEAREREALAASLGARARTVEVLQPGSVLGVGEASDALSLVAATEALRAGARVCLVVGEDACSGAAALVLTAYEAG